MSKALTRLAPDLRGSGIDYLNHRTGGRRQITLETVLEVASSTSLASSQASNPYGKGLSSDDAKTQNGDTSDASFITDLSASPSVTLSGLSKSFSTAAFQPFSDASDANDTKNDHSSTPCINTAELEEW